LKSDLRKRESASSPPTQALAVTQGWVFLQPRRNPIRQIQHSACGMTKPLLRGVSRNVSGGVLLPRRAAAADDRELIMAGAVSECHLDRRLPSGDARYRHG